MSAPGPDPARRPGVALVTGASRGTGLATAERLAAAGFEVWRLNRRPAPGSPPREILCDLADLAAVERAVEEVVAATGGRLDVLVANAVDRYFSPVASLDLGRWERALAVNLSSVLRLVQTALPALRGSRGTVVLMGSHAGSRFFEGGVSYCAAKAALKAVCEVLLMEERPHGVRTSLVSPGAIANEEEDRSRLKMTVDSVAELVEWIVSAPGDLVLGEIEVRPSRLAAPVVGLDRLQAV